MTAAVLYGASAGALHAVTGPDHVLSLGPLALHAPRGAFRVGLRWGLGHGLGTLILALPLLFLSHVVSLEAFASIADRIAGGVLLLTALWTWRSARQARTQGPDARSPSLVGFVHGATGAGALVLVLPVLVSGAPERSALFLVAFGVGSTVAMAALTAAIGRLGARLTPAHVSRGQTLLLAAAAPLGGAWLVL